MLIWFAGFALVLATDSVLVTDAVHGTNPGFKVRVSQAGLNYAASITVDVMSDKVKHVNIPDQSGKSKVGLAWVEYAVKNIRVCELILAT